jgi:hypothetical protein
MRWLTIPTTGLKYAGERLRRVTKGLPVNVRLLQISKKQCNLLGNGLISGCILQLDVNLIDWDTGKSFKKFILSPFGRIVINIIGYPFVIIY